MHEPPRVLAVDDERLMRMTYRHRLGELGYRVHTAGSVREAMDRLDGESYDLLMVDLALGEGQGLEVVAYAREVAASIKVILLASAPTDGEIERALRAGVDRIVDKPCPLHFLEEETRRVLRPGFGGTSGRD